MAPTRVNQLGEFTPLWEAMDRLITDAFTTQRGWTSWANGRQALPVEMYETPEEFVVRAYAPGVKPEDLSVEYEGGVLSIRGKTEVPELKEGWRVHLSEFGYGEFVRQFRLPRSIEIDNVRSTYEHGILTLVMPKAPEAKAKRIAIHTPAQLGSGSATG